MGRERRTLGMTRRLAVVTLFVALALPARALAKEPVKATVCGANGCANSQDKEAILSLVEGGPPASTPTAGAPAYRVRVTISVEGGSRANRGKTDTFTTWMSPALGVVRGSGGTWMTLPAATLAALRRIAPHIRPFPVARLPLEGRVAEPQLGASPSPSSAPPRATTPARASSTGTDWALVGGLVGGVLAALAGAVVAVSRRRRNHAATPAAGVSELTPPAAKLP